MLQVQEPAYFDRLQRMAASPCTSPTDACGLQLTALAAFQAITIHLFASNASADEREATEVEEKFDALVKFCEQRIARLKALHAAWDEFRSGLGVSASGIDT